MTRLLLLALVLSTASCIGPPKTPEAREPLQWRFTQSARARLGGHLAEAGAAWERLHSPGSNRRERAEAEERYEKALAAFLKGWSRAQAPRRWQDGAAFAAHRVRIQTRNHDTREITPRVLADLRLASEVRTGKAGSLAETDGLGVPLVGRVFESDQHPLLPRNGAHLTLTALLEFEKSVPGQPRECRLRLVNPLQQPRVRIEGKDTPLAANYTAPKALALDAGFLKKFSLTGLLYPEKTLDDSRLYQLDPYDPRRIPVVFVHGLMSDPHIWYPCINALCADPVLRAHFQPWYFLYPTGMYVPATSRRLRESIAEARDRLDPGGTSAAMNQMVLVGHSMGGLLSRMQAVDSGMEFWNAHFTKPPEEMRLSESGRERLRTGFIFEKRPEVARLIFIATPQRGSDLADKGIVMRLAKLIRLPVDSMLVVTELLSGNTDALQPQIRDWGVFSFLSLSTLSPRHPYIQALNARPIPVPHHSIIGRVGGRTLEDSSDLVVPYRSAHLPTGSERVVPHWHGCVEQPEVIAEVLKRLRQHLRESGRI
ncbi:MAG TPA: hypothetical protein PK490_11060 [Prosthecobacter sp.]|nr:hypothetical protein [Prosthecobacter sp.]HRK14823.1 hypothetical protein [Prosthecobacter sp.]